MKKLSFFLMAMLVSLTSFAEALGDGYEKVTNISTLAAGDKVVLYADDISKGVTGWSGSKDATVAESGWVEYLVEVASGGVYLKDETANNYIASPGNSNQFKYGTKAICTVDANGVLECNSRFLCQNNTYYRMYTAIGSYKPFYVYKVVETAAPGEATISVNAGSVDFGAVKVTELESVEAKTLTVTGTELTEGITVSLSDQNFTTDVTELPKEGGDIKIALATNLIPNTYETILTLTSGTTTKTVTLSVNVKDVYTITWNALGTTTTTTVVQGNKLVLPEEPTCDYKTFVGWATEAEVSADGSDIIFVNDFTIPTTSTTYYAVFAVMSDDATAEKTGTYTMESYAAGTQYAQNEEHKLDDDVTIYTSVCHFTSELRIYSSSSNNGYVISNELPGAIKSMSFNAGYKADNLVVYGSTDGSEWFEVGKIATQESYADYTLSFGETNYIYFKLDVEGTSQIRIKKFSITYLAPTYTDYSTTCEPEIEWMEMPLEISNLTTMEMPVDDVTYLRLMGRNDMDDADVMLFLNNYTGEEKAYEVNAESSYMTFGGLELTVMDGSITKSVDPELGDVYAGVVHASVYDDMMGETMYLALNLTMYALSVEPVEVVVENATVVIEERSMGFGDATYSVLILTGEWSDGETTYPVSLETSEFDPEQESQEVAATLTVGGWGDEDPWLGFGEGNATIAIVDNTVSVSGLFENQDTGFAANATISGTLPVVEYVLNGGVLPLVGPTNAELWEMFKPYYNEYYLTNGKLTTPRADQPIENVTTFAANYMIDIMTDAASEYKWLGDYVAKVTTDAGRTIDTEVLWRFGVAAFFNCKAAAASTWNGNADFTEAGKPENWVNVYPDAQEVVLPTEPVEEDYVLPTPTKSGSTFKGWYDNAEGTGEAYTVIPAGWSGTLYAIWEQGTTTALENIAVEGKAVKAIINGQLIIIKNGVQYNAQGQVIK